MNEPERRDPIDAAEALRWALVRAALGEDGAAELARELRESGAVGRQYHGDLLLDLVNAKYHARRIRGEDDE